MGELLDAIDQAQCAGNAKHWIAELEATYRHETEVYAAALHIFEV
jgi:hypothetical protein